MVKVSSFLMIIIVFHPNLKKITSKIENDSTKDVEIMVTLKYLIKLLRNFEVQLIICEINLFLT